MTKDQIAIGVNAGLAFFGPDSKAKIPSELNDGIFFLKQFLGNVAQGKLAITPVVEEGDGSGDPATPKRKARRANLRERQSTKSLPTS